MNLEFCFAIAPPQPIETVWTWARRGEVCGLRCVLCASLPRAVMVPHESSDPSFIIYTFYTFRGHPVSGLRTLIWKVVRFSIDSVQKTRIKHLLVRPGWSVYGIAKPCMLFLLYKLTILTKITSRRPQHFTLR